MWNWWMVNIAESIWIWKEWVLGHSAYGRIDSWGVQSNASICRQSDEGHRRILSVAILGCSSERYKVMISKEWKHSEHYGRYFNGFTNWDIKCRYVVSSKFQPTYARRAFPCFDEPSFKSTYKISLVKPTHLTALSNMPVEVSFLIKPNET